MVLSCSFMFGQRDSLYMSKLRTYQPIDTTEIDRDVEYEVVLKHYSVDEGSVIRRDTVDTYAAEYIRQLIAQAVSDSVNLRSFLEVHYDNYKKANTDYFTLKNYLTALRNVATGAPMSRQVPEASLQPKVLRALVNQSGTSDPQTATSGTLTVGVSYEITTFETGDDFTNVGAPSNANGVKFIATGTTPTVWTEGSTLAWDNGAPVLIIYENTIGNIWTLYGEPSTYYINSDALFTDNKTVITNGFNENNPYYKPISGNLRRIHNNVADNSTISLSGKIVDDYDSVVSEPDDVIYNWYIEILVYP